MTRDDSGRDLVKMAVLARRSGVPAATIKHYLKERVLPPLVVRKNRTMSLYDAALVPRIKAIKELQRTRFLPLKLIRKVLDGAEPLPDEQAAAEAIARALKRMVSDESRTRAEVIAAGTPADELDYLEGVGAVRADASGGEPRYAGEDLSLLRILADARRAGLTAEMLPASILGPYTKAVRELVQVELRLFREGVLPRARKDLPALAEAATRLSERLVLHLRRRHLVPVLEEMFAAGAGPRGGPRRRRSGAR